MTNPRERIEIPTKEEFQKALKKIQDNPEMKKIKQEIRDSTRLTAEDLNFRINTRDDDK